MCQGRLRVNLAGHRLRVEEGRPIQPTRADFENLLSFRVALRRFQRWSEDQASAVGLTHVQHQLLVAIKGIRYACRRPSARLLTTCCCKVTA